MGKGRRNLPQSHVELHGPSFAEFAGLLVDSDKSERESSHEQRRARQDEYRTKLDVQVADILARRENDARRLQELDRRDEMKSVGLVHYIQYVPEYCEAQRRWVSPYCFAARAAPRLHLPPLKRHSMLAS